MKKLLILAIFMAFCLVLVAQIPDTLWTRTINGPNYEYAENVKTTNDGGCIMVGSTNSYGNGGYDIYLIKLGIYGNLQWSRTFGGNQQDMGYCVEQTSDNGYIITGFTRSFGAGDTDLWLIKTDSSGNLQWEETIGGNVEDDDVGVSIKQTSDDGYIITGYTRSYGDVSGDIWLVKTDSSGNLQWNRTFGGDGWDTGRSVYINSDGGYVISGHQNYVTHLIKTDSNGNILWNREFPDYQDCYSVQQTLDGGFILCGSTSSCGAGNWDAYLIKTNSDGYTQWNRTFGTNQEDYGRCAIQTSNGEYVLFGTTNSFGLGSYDTWLIEIDQNGYEQWNKTIGTTGDDEGYSIAETTDGGYIMAGYSNGGVYVIRIVGKSALFNAIPKSGYTPLAVNFQDQSMTLNNPITSWQWTFGDGATSTEQNPVHLYGQVGQYTVKLKIIDSSGIADSLTKVNYITVLEVPPAPPENVNVVISNRNAVITWDPVTTNIFDEPIAVTGYIVYFSEVADTSFWYLAFVENTTYTHFRVTQFADGMFYRVSAYTDDVGRIRSLVNRNPHFKFGELEAMLKEE